MQATVLASHWMILTKNFGDDIEVDYDLPRKLNYDVELLDRFCRKDPDCVLTFYGGEPLLGIDKIRQIMDTVAPKHFMIQTNGLLLDKLEPKYVNRFPHNPCFHRWRRSLNRLLPWKRHVPQSHRQPQINQAKRLQRGINCQNDNHGANRHLQTSPMALRQQRILLFFGALAI